MMLPRDKILIPVPTLQRAINEFTLSMRHWQSFSADKIEHIMRYYHAMPHGFYYTGVEIKEDGSEYVRFMSNPMSVESGEINKFRKKIEGSEIKLITSG